TERGEELALRALLHLEPDVDLARVYVLGVLVELGAAGAARRRDDLGLLEERLLHHAPELVRLRERRARERHRGEGERSLIEVGQERSPREDEPRHGRREE